MAVLEVRGFAGAASTRPFSEADRLACQAIAAAAALSSYAPSMPDLVHTFDGRAPLEVVDHRWVALWDDRVIGFIDLVGNHVANLFVLPEAQGRGIGTLLLETVEANTAGNLTLSVFTVNPRARRFYERVGYGVTAREQIVFRGAQKTVWRMRKRRTIEARYRLVAFDFDGVLADSAAWMLATLPTICEEFALRRLSSEALNALRGAPTRTVLRELQVPVWKIPFIARRLRQLSVASAGEIALFPGVEDLILGLQRQGVKTAVVSSNSEIAVRKVLGEALSNAIDLVDCGVGLFGKADRLIRLARKAKISASEAVYVGDETRDVEAASRAGYDSAAVAWGYATPDALLLARPTKLVSDFGVLTAWLNVR